MMIIVCPSCGAKNRVPEDKLDSQPSCGQCHETLIPLAPIELNEQNFSNIVTNSDLPILVDLWAEWCGPCKMMAPIIEEIEKELTDIKFIKVNVDEAEEIAARYGIMSIPTFFIFNNGELVKKTVGGHSKQEMIDFINK